jgi:two-component system cell cycle response regulator DivK
MRAYRDGTSVSKAGTGRVILIVEDNDRNMKLVRDVLQFHDFRTLEATNAEDGIRLAGERLPDVVLMDIALPGIDGVSAAQQLRNEPSTSRIPVVALTASVSQADHERFASAGFAGCISKPIDVVEFANQVLGYCESTAAER